MSWAPALRAEALLFAEVGGWLIIGLSFCAALGRLLSTVILAAASLTVSSLASPGRPVAVLPASIGGTAGTITALVASARWPSGATAATALTSTARGTTGFVPARGAAASGATRSAAALAAAVSVTGAYCLDAAVDTEYGVDGRTNIVLEAREVQQIPLGIEGNAEGLTVERHGGAAHRDRPCHAANLGQCGNNFRPGCPQQFDLAALVGGGMSLRALSRGSLATTGFAGTAGRP